jgi:hypothetical protein
MRVGGRSVLGSRRSHPAFTVSSAADSGRRGTGVGRAERRAFVEREHLPVVTTTPPPATGSAGAI